MTPKYNKRFMQFLFLLIPLPYFTIYLQESRSIIFQYRRGISYSLKYINTFQSWYTHRDSCWRWRSSSCMQKGAGATWPPESPFSWSRRFHFWLAQSRSTSTPVRSPWSPSPTRSTPWSASPLSPSRRSDTSPPSGTCRCTCPPPYQPHQLHRTLTSPSPPHPSTFSG